MDILSRLIAASAALVLAALFFPASPAAAAPPTGAVRGAEVLSIETVSGPGGARVFMNLSRPPRRVKRAILAPPLIYIDIEGAYLPAGLAVAEGKGVIKEVRASQIGGATVRLSILTEENALHRVSLEERETFVLTVEVRENGAAAGKEPAPYPAPYREWFTGDRVNLSGYARNETAWTTARGGGLSKMKNIFSLKSTGFLTDDISYKAEGRAFYDAVFDLTDNFPSSVEEEQETEAVIRDAYLDISMGDWDARLGKQQIVWGEAVGLFFSDVVNAKDLSEFVLPDFEYIRIPQWAADIEYTMDALHLELVWIPVLAFNELGAQGSSFPQAVAVPAGVLPSFRPTSEPSDSLENSEAGARFSYLINGWDLSLFHLYTWDKFPSNFRTVTAPGLYTFSPEHKRLNITGATFAKEVRDIILKGELVYTHGKNFSVLDESDQDGVVKRDFIDYLIGADYTMFEKVDLNVQLMQRVILGAADNLFRQDKVQTSASVRLKTGFRENTIEPELLVITSLDKTDMMIRPRVSYKHGSRLVFRGGADLFEGSADGLFGQYDASDRVWVETEYNF